MANNELEKAQILALHVKEKKRKKFKRIIGTIALVIVLFVAWFGLVIYLEDFDFESFSKKTTDSPSTYTSAVMGTTLTVTTYNGTDSFGEEVESLLTSYEEEDISWRVEGSEVNLLNENYVAGEPYAISANLASYILVAREVSDAAGGVLDVTIRPLADLWGIEDTFTGVPSDEDIEGALAYVDYRAVHVLDQAGAELTSYTNVDTYGQYFVVIDKEGMTIDLGAIGKGAACEVVYESIADTDFLLNECTVVAVGGSLLCAGVKPSGERYQIGITNPSDDPDAYILGTVAVDASDGPKYISTSGTYEKYYDVDGVRYHHILDPGTGYPSDTGTLSATIICDNGALSDALSTACVLLDVESALALAEEFDAAAFIVTEEGLVYTTGVDSFSLYTTQYTVAH